MSAEWTDGDLIRSAIDGDDDAFATLVDRYKDKVYWIAFGLTGDAEGSRDVTQEAFVRVYRALDRFDFRMSFYTWLYRISVNLAIDQLRRNRRLRAVDIDELADRVPGNVEEPIENLERQELRDQVHTVLSKLPAKYRRVLALRDLNGLSCVEIAAIVGVSHSTARWRLHMARKMFKAQWERQQPAHRRVDGDAMP